MTHWRRVVKLGGSLLAWRAWPSHFRAWISTPVDAANVLLFGGGARVDALRRAWAAGALDDKVAHWQAIRMISENTRQMAAQYPEWTLVDQMDVIRQTSCAPGAIGPTWLFDPQRYLAAEDSLFADGPLPEGWEVTSDSIAARVCECLGYDELVLLKSCLPNGDATTRTAWAKIGYVDRFFPRASCRLPRVRCVDLRSPGFPTLESNL